MGLPVEAGVIFRGEAQALALGLSRHDAGFQGHQLVADELLHQVLEHALLFGKLEVHGVPPFGLGGH